MKSDREEFWIFIGAVMMMSGLILLGVSIANLIGTL